MLIPMRGRLFVTAGWSSGSPHGLHWHHRQGGPTKQGWKSWLPTGPSVTPPGGSVGVLHCGPAKWNSRVPTRPLGGGWVTVFFICFVLFFGVWPELNSHWLKVFCLSWLPLSWPFDQREKAFVKTLGISGCQLLQLQSGVYEVKQDLGNFPRVRRFLAGLPPCLCPLESYVYLK